MKITHTIKKIDGEYRATFRVDGVAYPNWTAFDTDRASIQGTAKAVCDWFEKNSADEAFTFNTATGNFDVTPEASIINEICDAIENVLNTHDTKPRLVFTGARA